MSEPQKDEAVIDSNRKLVSATEKKSKRSSKQKKARSSRKRDRRSTSTNDRTRLESEKARAVMWLGILAIIATYRVALPPGAYFIFFPYCESPCPHLQIFWAPLLDTLITWSFAYFLSMLIYFSEDYLPSSRGQRTREFFRRIGNYFLYLIPVTLIFVIVAAEFSFFLPGWAQSAYWASVYYLFARSAMWILEGITGKRGLFRRFERSLGEAVVHSVERGIEFVRDEARKLGERLRRGQHRETPKDR